MQSCLGAGVLPGGRAGFLRHEKQVPFMQFNPVHPTSPVQLCGGVRLQQWSRSPEGRSRPGRGSRPDPDLLIRSGTDRFRGSERGGVAACWGC